MTLACPNCHHPLPPEFKVDPIYTYSLTPGLVHVLRKLAVAVWRKGANDVHLEDDIQLTLNEQCCTSKLRFFGLIAQVRKSGEKQAKRWLLTRRGWRFLNAQEPVHEWVKVQSNHLVQRSIATKYIAAFPTSEYPWLQSVFPYEIDAQEVFQSKLPFTHQTL